MHHTRKELRKNERKRRNSSLLLKSSITLSTVGALIFTANLIPAQNAANATPVVSLDAASILLEAPGQSLTVTASEDKPESIREVYKTSTLAEIQAKQKAIDDEAKRVKEEKEAEERAKQEAIAPKNESNQGNSSNSTRSAVKNVITGMFSEPIKNWRSKVGDGFQTKNRPNHNGLDFPASLGTPIYAVADGTITKSEYYGTYGYVVYLRSTVDGQTMETRYAHQPEQPPVSVGQTVEAGDVIGYVGSTGRSTGNHLHFEVVLNGKQINPYNWLDSNVF